MKIYLFTMLSCSATTLLAAGCSSGKFSGLSSSSVVANAETKKIEPSTPSSNAQVAQSSEDSSANAASDFDVSASTLPANVMGGYLTCFVSEARESETEYGCLAFDKTNQPYAKAIGNVDVKAKLKNGDFVTLNIKQVETGDVRFHYILKSDLIGEVDQFLIVAAFDNEKSGFTISSSQILAQQPQSVPQGEAASTEVAKAPPETKIYVCETQPLQKLLTLSGSKSQVIQSKIDLPEAVLGAEAYHVVDADVDQARDGLLRHTLTISENSTQKTALTNNLNSQAWAGTESQTQSIEAVPTFSASITANKDVSNVKLNLYYKVQYQKKNPCIAPDIDITELHPGGLQ